MSFSLISAYIFIAIWVSIGLYLNTPFGLKHGLFGKKKNKGQK